MFYLMMHSTHLVKVIWRQMFKKKKKNSNMNFEIKMVVLVQTIIL